MPHDKHGRLVQIGDRVTVTGEVKHVGTEPDYCNLTMSAPYEPPKKMGFSVTCNTSETERACLTFDQLRNANAKRLPEFKNSKGEPTHSKPDGSDWSPLEWGGAAAGELGELCNLAKKLKRGDVTLDDIEPKEGCTIREAMAREIADVMIYLDILGMQVGVDAGEAVRDKFNRVSDKIKCQVKL